MLSDQRDDRHYDEHYDEHYDRHYDQRANNVQTTRKQSEQANKQTVYFVNLINQSVAIHLNTH